MKERDGVLIEEAKTFQKKGRDLESIKRSKENFEVKHLSRSV